MITMGHLAARYDHLRTQPKSPERDLTMHKLKAKLIEAGWRLLPGGAWATPGST